jgi:hypothetical protein
MEWDTIDQYWKDNFINSDNILLRINFIKQDQKKEFLDKLSKTHVVIYTEDEFQERSPNMIVLAVKNLIPSILPTI